MATPWPMLYDLKEDELVIFSSGNGMPTSDVGRISSKHEHMHVFDIALVPTKDGGVRYTVGNVHISKISHHLKLVIQ